MSKHTASINKVYNSMNTLSFQKLVDDIDWNMHESETQYLTHNIHRYSGKFIPQIARMAIEVLTSPGDIVIDPFSGSGTTLLECALLKRHSIGFDLNPLAVLISKVKASPVSSEKLNFLYEYLSLRLFKESEMQDFLFDNQYTKNAKESIIGDHRLVNPWYNKWYSRKTLEGLIKIHTLIDSLDEGNLRDIALIAFSNILRRTSNAHSGYPNVMLNKNLHKSIDPIPVFLNSLKDTIFMVKSIEKSISDEYVPTVRRCNSESIPLENNSIDSVITHPPYIGSIPYAEYGQLSITWLGSEVREIDAQLTGGRRQSKDVVDRFRTSYGKIIVESARVLKKGGSAFFMTGNPVVKGVEVDLSAMTIQLTQAAGLTLIGHTQRSGINRRANKMGIEDLMFFKK